MKLLICILIALLFVTVCLAEETEQGIYFKGGTFHKGNPQLHKPLLQAKYFTLDDSLRVPFDSVRAYQDAKGYYLAIQHLFLDTNFGKRVINGRISVFESYESNMYMMDKTGDMGGASPPVYHFTTTENDTIYPFAMEYLQPILATDPDCAKYIKKYNNAMTWHFLGFVGIVVGGMGALALTPNKDDNSTGIVVCLGFSAVSFLSIFINKANSEYHKAKAIEEYNKE